MFDTQNKDFRCSIKDDSCTENRKWKAEEKRNQSEKKDIFMCTREQTRVPPVLIYKHMAFFCANHVDCVASLLSVKGPFPIKLFSHRDSPGPSPLLLRIAQWRTRV